MLDPTAEVNAQFTFTVLICCSSGAEELFRGSSCFSFSEIQTEKASKPRPNCSHWTCIPSRVTMLEQNERHMHTITPLGLHILFVYTP